MAIKTVRQALVNQLKADSTLTTFVSSADNIKAGIERTITAFTGTVTKLVRVIQLEEDEEYAVLSGKKANTEYLFHVVGIFYEDDEEIAEDTAADFSKNLKNAISSDFTLSGSGNVHNIEIQQSFYRSHPEKPLNYVIIPVLCKAQVTVTNR